MAKKKTKIVMVGVVVLIAFLLTLGISYAIWSMTLTQETSNVITTGCFKIEFQDSNPISLSEIYPITDEEGLKFEPYTFTITNTCESYASYQINLEILNTTTLNRFEFVKNSLNEKEPSVLTNFDTVQTTLENATTSKKLETGYLDKLESKTFTLRLWLAEDTPAIEDVMNKTIESKITVITSLLPESPSYAEVITNCSNNGYRTVDCMLENSKYDTVNLAYDETIDNNLRYIGANPNNYVEFNDELWRVIGVMNNVEDADGLKDSRLKLIRDESIGEYSWDTSDSTVNSGWGVNEWSQADLMKLLNPGYETEGIGGSLYWNRGNGACYNGQNNATTSCDFNNIGLLENSKLMIENIIWNLGTFDRNQYTDENVITKDLYNFEKSNYTRKICSSGNRCTDNVLRTNKWLGYIALIYPSDYGYATSGGSENGRKDCLEDYLFQWKNSELKKCSANNWIYMIDVDKNIYKSLITPIPMTGENDVHFAIGNLSTNGFVSRTNASGNGLIVPSLYLRSNVKIVDGDGTKKNAYKLEMVGE